MTTANVLELKKFQPKDFENILGTKGFSDKMLKDHFKLYEGYVKNTNSLIDEFDRLTDEKQADSPAFAELKRRFGWEYNGMRLHEYYFENFGADHESELSTSLKSEITAHFKSWERWKEQFLATASMRGIGWAILYRDPASQRLFNTWIDEHNNGHLVGGEPVLVLDVFEHAFMTDYGTDRKSYLTNFFAQINWGVVENRAFSLKGGAAC